MLNSVATPRVNPPPFMTKTPEKGLTIGRLAKRAGVNLETIRYYQQRKLLAVPPAQGAYRYYPLATVDRIRFIKRAQELGFSLAEINELLKLDETRDRRLIRKIANSKLGQIEQKLADLARMQQMLQHVVQACEHTGLQQPCPIIASLSAQSRE